MNTLRMRLLLAHFFVIAVTMASFMLVTFLVTPRIRDRIVNDEQWQHDNSMPDGRGPMPRMTVERVYNAAVWRGMWIAAGVASITAIAISITLARLIVAPLHTVIAASRRVAAGDFSLMDVPTNTTEIHALTQQFNYMAGALKDAEHRRATLIGDVAHELRTPLASIGGYAEGLIDGVILPNTKTFGIIRDEASRMQRLVDDLQALSRAEAGSLVLNRQYTDLHAIVQQAQDLLQPRFTEKSVTLSITHQHATEPLQCDGDRICQILVNLLTNALRAVAPQGLVELSTGHDAHMVWCRVHDNGIGIDATHIDHIFERFYRVDPSRTRATGGAGVGLTIARAIAEAHGGTLTVTSPGLGRGATFTLQLPRS